MTQRLKNCAVTVSFVFGNWSLSSTLNRRGVLYINPAIACNHKIPKKKNLHVCLNSTWLLSTICQRFLSKSFLRFIWCFYSFKKSFYSRCVVFTSTSLKLLLYWQPRISVGGLVSNYCIQFMSLSWGQIRVTIVLVECPCVRHILLTRLLSSLVYKR